MVKLQNTSSHVFHNLKQLQLKKYQAYLSGQEANLYIDKYYIEIQFSNLGQHVRDRTHLRSNLNPLSICRHGFFGSTRHAGLHTEGMCNLPITFRRGGAAGLESMSRSHSHTVVESMPSALGSITSPLDNAGNTNPS